MGLTASSTGFYSDISESLPLLDGESLIAFAGNPNVGKSTIFNSLTGLRQHTGNWCGKTVGCAFGRCRIGQRDFVLADLPGTYSLSALSAEEGLARDFIRHGGAERICVVCDAGCLSRGLRLALQVMAEHADVVLCVNLLDEAAKKGICPDLNKLSDKLGVPVVGTSAAKGEGYEELLTALAAPPREHGRQIDTDPVALGTYARQLSSLCCTTGREPARGIDAILTHPIWGLPAMALLLAAVLFITIKGANVPSALLSKGLFSLGAILEESCLFMPEWLRSALFDGIWRTMASVAAVMLPPMAIFFPLFTLLEDVGYLPRVAFNLDGCFQKARGSGKQALTMC